MIVILIIKNLINQFLLSCMQRMLPSQQICHVCEEPSSELYEMSNCHHSFCKKCCITYIETQVNSFSQAKCLEEGCNQPLNQDKPIYTFLMPQIIKRIQKFAVYKYLQDHPQYKNCKMQDCNGYFGKNNKTAICNLCSREHCKRCFTFKHEGVCIVSEQEKQLKQLNLRKCPKCSIWVEKIAGCEYISCKCGTDFCFKCGVVFAKDPCRNQYKWAKQEQIRHLMKRVVLERPVCLQDYCVFVPKLLLKIIVIVPFTVVFCLLPMIICFALTELLAFLFMPLVLLYPISTLKEKKVIACVCFVIFYPIVGLLMALLFLMITVLYPFIRNKYHHGVYDPYDKAMVTATHVYLTVIVCLIQL